MEVKQEEEVRAEEKEGSEENSKRRREEAQLEAAVRAGLPVYALGESEASAFRDILDEASSTGNRRECEQQVVTLRNCCLTEWNADASRFTTLKQCLAAMSSDGDERLMRRVYTFLCCHGYINFGHVPPTREPHDTVDAANTDNAEGVSTRDGDAGSGGDVPPLSGKKVIIVGAGASGLAAAFQLKHWYGCDVTVLEARDRIGGRISTDSTTFSVPVDLGASIVTGTEADVQNMLKPDPSAQLLRQALEKKKKQQEKMMTSDTEAEAGDGRIDEDDSDTILYHIRSKDKDCPLFDCITGQKLREDVDSRATNIHNSMLDQVRDKIEAEGEGAMHNQSLGTAMDAALKNHIALHMLSANRITEAEKRAIAWQAANLEYGCSARLDQVSAAHWDGDEQFGGFGGPHCFVNGGYVQALDELAASVDVQLSNIVTQVDVREKNVCVTVQSGDGDDGPRVIEADAVLVSVPLGVLKSKAIEFVPPLPDWKRSAIERLGMGNLNKIVLEFPERFWGDVDMFGATLNPDEASRGRCFFFWSLHRASKKPILVGLLSGRAAQEVESRPDEDIRKVAMHNLRQVFGRSNDMKPIPEPLSFTVTRWASDPFACGSYSYVAVGASLKDYDDLGRPVSFYSSVEENDGEASITIRDPARVSAAEEDEHASPSDQSKGIPHATSSSKSSFRLFFAGEHTWKYNVDTVGGAILSGKREAVRIAMSLLGRDPDAEAGSTMYTGASDAARKDISERVESIRRRAMDMSGGDGGREIQEDMLALMGDMETRPRRFMFAEELLQFSAATLKKVLPCSCLQRLATWIEDDAKSTNTEMLSVLLKLSSRIPYDSKEDLKATALPKAIIVARKSRKATGGGFFLAAEKVLRRWQKLEEKRHADTTNGGHANAEDRAREMEHNERMRRIQEEKVAAAERARAAEVAADEAIARAREQENVHDAMTTEHGNVEMEMDYFDIEEFNKQRKRKRKMEEKEKMQNGAHERSKNGDKNGTMGAALTESDDRGEGGGDQSSRRTKDNRSSDNSHKDGVDRVKYAVRRYLDKILQPHLDRDKLTQEQKDAIAHRAFDKIIGGSTYLTETSERVRVSEFMSDKRRAKMKGLVNALLSKHGIKAKV